MIYSHKGAYPQELPETIVVAEIVFEEITHDVVTDENGVEEVITKTETVGNNIEVEYSAPFSDELLEKAGYIAVPDKPQDTDFITYTWNKSEWVAEDSEAAKLRTKKWFDIRRTRNFLLSDSDSEIQKCIDNNQDIPQEWIDYRESLRNIPQAYETGSIDDWVSVVFPVNVFDETEGVQE